MTAAVLTHRFCSVGYSGLKPLIALFDCHRHSLLQGYCLCPAFVSLSVIVYVLGTVLYIYIYIYFFASIV